MLCVYMLFAVISTESHENQCLWTYFLSLLITKHKLLKMLFWKFNFEKYVILRRPCYVRLMLLYSVLLRKALKLKNHVPPVHKILCGQKVKSQMVSLLNFLNMNC